MSAHRVTVRREGNVLHVDVDGTVAIDQTVRDTNTRLDDMTAAGELSNGLLISVTGSFPIPVAMVLAYRLDKLFQTVAVCDCELYSNYYIVSGARNISYCPGDMISKRSGKIYHRCRVYKACARFKKAAADARIESLKKDSNILRKRVLRYEDFDREQVVKVHKEVPSSRLGAMIFAHEIGRSFESSVPPPGTVAVFDPGLCQHIVVMVSCSRRHAIGDVLV